MCNMCHGTGVSIHLGYAGKNTTLYRTAFSEETIKQVIEEA